MRKTQHLGVIHCGNCFGKREIFESLKSPQVNKIRTRFYKQLIDLVFSYLSFISFELFRTSHTKATKSVQTLVFLHRIPFSFVKSRCFSKFSAFFFLAFQVFPHSLNKKWKTRKSRDNTLWKIPTLKKTDLENMSFNFRIRNIIRENNFLFFQVRGIIWKFLNSREKRWNSHQTHKKTLLRSLL